MMKKRQKTGNNSIANIQHNKKKTCTSLFLNSISIPFYQSFKLIAALNLQ